MIFMTLDLPPISFGSPGHTRKAGSGQVDGETAEHGSKEEGLYKHGEERACPPGQCVSFRDWVGSGLLGRLSLLPSCSQMGRRGWESETGFRTQF